jgi:IS30 family transposase
MIRWGVSERDQERMWELWQEGHSTHSIGRELGTYHQYVQLRLRESGGIKPPPRRRAQCHLSASEREEISRGLARGESFRAIGETIGRPHTTVSREVNRDGGRCYYRAQHADEAAWERARRPKPSKLQLDSGLRAIVEEKLELDWSPRQISRWLRRAYGDDGSMQISHETIYLSLYVQSRGALRRELCAHLRRGRRMRRPQTHQHAEGRGKLPGMVMISERPAEAEDRAVPGHWEGDLLLGKRPTGIATLVERATRYCQLVELPDGLGPEQVRVALYKSIGSLPEQLRRSLTWDQGKEMAQHAQFTIDSGVQIYFCDRYSSWQRGSNENTNGLLRQYFPKRSDLSRFSQDELDELAAKLNGRPRETLGWQTPAERLAQVLAKS